MEFLQRTVGLWIDGGWTMDDSVVLARELRARGVDVIDCCFQAPEAFFRGKGTQELAVAIENFGRDCARFLQRGRVVSVCPIQRSDRGSGRDGSHPQAYTDAPQAAHQGAVETVIAPAAVRADSCGRYMSSTFAAGRS